MSESERLDAIEQRLSVIEKLLSGVTEVGGTGAARAALWAETKVRHNKRTWDELKQRAREYVRDFNLISGEVVKYRDFQIRAHQETRNTDFKPEAMLKELVADGTLVLVVLKTNTTKRGVFSADMFSGGVNTGEFLARTRDKGWITPDKVWAAE